MSGVTSASPVGANPPSTTDSRQDGVSGALKRTFEQMQASLSLPEGPANKKPRLTCTVPVFEIKVQIAEEEFRTFQIPKNALFMLSPLFRRVFDEQTPEGESGTATWIGPLPRPYIHPVAVEHILQFARLKTGFLEEKETQSLADIKRGYPQVFDLIFADIVRLSDYYEINDLKQKCAQFLTEDLRSSPSKNFLFYFSWAIQFRFEDLLLSSLRLLRNKMSFRMAIYPALIDLFQAEGTAENKVAWQRAVHHCFNVLLPDDLGDKEIIEIAKCFYSIFPRYEASAGVRKKIGSYSKGSAVPPRETANIEELLAISMVRLGIICGSETFIDEDFLSDTLENENLQELRALFSSASSLRNDRIGALVDFHTRYPKNILAMKWLCELYLDADNLRLCLEMCERILALKEDDSDAYVYRSRCCFEKDERESAFRDLARAYEYDPLNPSIFEWRSDYFDAMGNTDAAMRDHDVWVELELKSSFPFVERGKCHMKKKDFEAALSDFKQALIFHPKDVEILYKIAETCLLMEQFYSSLEYIRRITSLSPRHFFALQLAGKCYLAMNQYPKAIAIFTHAISATGEPAPVTLTLRGKCHLLSGDYGMAQADVRAALELDPNCAEAIEFLEHLNLYPS